MSNAPGSSFSQHHQDLPIVLNNSSPKQTTTDEKQEHRSRLAQPPSRRVQERWKQLKDSDPKPDPKLEKLQNEILQLHQLEHGLMERYRELDQEITETKQRLKRRRAQRVDLKKITGELAVAQRFLSTADSLSEAEVIRDMEALNEEIFQLAAIAADKVQVQEQCFPTDEESTRYKEKIDHILGPEFIELVVTKKLQDVLAIQMGWQAILTHLCSYMIQVWYFKDRCVDQDISRMYRNMRSQSEAYYAFPKKID